MSQVQQQSVQQWHEAHLDLGQDMTTVVIRQAELVVLVPMLVGLVLNQVQQQSVQRSDEAHLVLEQVIPIQATPQAELVHLARM